MTDSYQTPGEVTAAQPSDDREIVAKPGRYYRNMRYIIALALVVCAAWFAYDGWVAWPRNNAEVEAALAVSKKPPHKLRTQTDIRWQKRLATILPIMALGTLAWTHYNSRGRYRLAGNRLEVPGHPPIELTEITGVDQSKWKRKGILYVDYATAAGASDRLRLDDFVYEQVPTDAIGKRILEAVGQSEDDADDGESENDGDETSLSDDAPAGSGQRDA